MSSAANFPQFVFYLLIAGRFVCTLNALNSIHFNNEFDTEFPPNTLEPHYNTHFGVYSELVISAL